MTVTKLMVCSFGRTDSTLALGYDKFVQRDHPVSGVGADEGIATGRRLSSTNVDTVDHHVAVLVQCRLKSGQWKWWRVGRRRLAWRPTTSVFELLQFADGPLTFVIGIPVLLWWLLNWAAALLATAVVWPVRMVIDRWPVVAYMPYSLGDDGLECRWVKGRKEADSTARRWVADIRREGRPGTAAHSEPA